MTIRELCKYINITTPTIYNWKKEKPNLYKIIMDFNHHQNIGPDKKEQELLKLFRQLNKQEQKYYISEIKTRVLKREIDKEGK